MLCVFQGSIQDSLFPTFKGPIKLIWLGDRKYVSVLPLLFLVVDEILLGLYCNYVALFREPLNTRAFFCYLECHCGIIFYTLRVQ